MIQSLIPVYGNGIEVAITYIRDDINVTERYLLPADTKKKVYQKRAIDGVAKELEINYGRGTCTAAVYNVEQATTAPYEWTRIGEALFTF